MNIIIGALLSFGMRFATTSSVSRGEYGEIKLFQSPATYSVESMIQLNDASRKDKEVAYKVSATLNVQAVWGVDSDFLLKFVLTSPKLLARGKLVTADYLPIKSFWDAHYKTEFYAHWKNGLITEAYLNPEEMSDVLNYKKSLISLFQLQIIDGEHNETDISGTCDVLYDSVSTQVIRKTKKWCRAPGSEDEALPEERFTSRRLTRYTLSEKLDALDEVHAEEVHTAGFQGMHAAIKARAWLRLRREGPPRSTSTVYSELDTALAKLPASLKPLPLPMIMTDEPLQDDGSLEEALNQAVRDGEDEEAGGGGTGAAAAAGLRAVRALRAAQPERVAAALRAQPDSRTLAALCRLAGASGAAGAHAAVSHEVPLTARDAPPLAMLYLQALALAEAPDESVVLDALRVGGEARAAPVREAALLAAAAGAARLQPRRPRASATLRDALPRHLAHCVEDECRAAHVRALGNLGRGDAAELLLQQAERGGPVALHALEALQALPPADIGPSRQRRLAVLAAASRPLEQRAAALDLFLVRAAPLPPPLVLARLSHELYMSGPNELRRLFWQRARQLAEQHRPLADVLAMLPPHVRGWDALAQSGTSSVMVRSLGPFGAGSAQLESLQLARGGLLRRGTVRLLLQDVPAPLLAIELWTRGLESLTGDAGGSDGESGQEEGEAAGGGLALVVGGARLPGLALFSGQAELLGHIWAGTGSSATPAVRALLPLGERELRVPLLGAGGLRMRTAAALALALDAQAQVSLWSRTARTELELRVGAAVEVRAELRAAGGTVRADVHAHAEPRLRVAADLDFYDRVALCVRVTSDDHVLRSNTTLRSVLGAAKRGVRRERSVLAPRPGRTLALGALNDAACKVLLA